MLACLRPHSWRGLLLTPAGDLVGQEYQAAALEHSVTGEVQINTLILLPQLGRLLVLDISNNRSFEHVKDWLEEAKMYVQPCWIVSLLVGHKCHLVSQHQVTRGDAGKLSRLWYEVPRNLSPRCYEC